MTPTLDESRAAILGAIGPPGERFTWYRSDGNLGDALIEAGTHLLLKDYKYDALYDTDLRDHPGGELLVIGGGGGWCRAWRHSALVLADALPRFDRIVVLPSTFDVNDPVVRLVLGNSTPTTTVFAREGVSFDTVSKIRTVQLAHCPAFFFDYEPYRVKGEGILFAYRDDHEKANLPIPPSNRDISTSTAGGLDNWMRSIASQQRVYTDRAHVAIAASLLGKDVRVRANSYFKVRAIVDTWNLPGVQWRDWTEDSDRIT